jgi:hypothetical protein
VHSQHALLLCKGSSTPQCEACVLCRACMQVRNSGAAHLRVGGDVGRSVWKSGQVKVWEGMGVKAKAQDVAHDLKGQERCQALLRALTAGLCMQAPMQHAHFGRL